jgi:hypothetical protein
MKITGKILFFNASEGKGILITSDKQKISFSVEVWDDFEVMPSLGLEVKCLSENDEIIKIVSLENEADLIGDENQETSEMNEAAYEEEQVSEDEGDASELTDDTQTQEDESTHTQNITEEESSTESQESGLEASEEAQEQAVEHFKDEKEVNALEPEEFSEDELPLREESLSVTMNLPKAISNYFNVIKENVDKRKSYTKVQGRLNYLVIRRFLWTTFNNVSELDLHIITPKVKALSDDLKEMSKLFDDFMRKIKHPPLAYEEVFLSCQAEYLKIREGAEKTIEKLNALKNNEKYIGEVLKVKKEELEENIESDEFDVLKEDFKSMNGAYVDVVHMMAELDERYKHDMKLLVEFEKEYREDFYELFQAAAVEYKKDIIDILSAQAYILDAELWQKAKGSKSIKAHFHKAGINGSFNTKTYLKYYLDTLDSGKMTEETKKLYDLYDYLCAVYKDCIMIVSASANDAMDHESSVKSIDKSYEVKAFIDEKSALKWAIKHSVKVLVLEDRLVKMKAETFLQYYKKYVLLIPKIIILGENIKSIDYSISKLLSSGISSRVLADNVRDLLKA